MLETYLADTVAIWLGLAMLSFAGVGLLAYTLTIWQECRRSWKALRADYAADRASRPRVKLPRPPAPPTEVVPDPEADDIDEHFHRHYLQTRHHGRS